MMLNTAVDRIDDKNERLDYMDFAKGIGILLVVLGHNLQGIPYMTSWIYTFHMPLFFVISGYLEEHKSQKGIRQKDFKAYFISKLSALMWPYFTFSVVNLVWLVVFNLVMGVTPEDAFAVIAFKMVSTYGYRALWFLPAIFFASVISHLCERKNTVLFLALFAMTGIVCSQMTNCLSSESLWLYLVRYFGRIALGASFLQIGKLVYTPLRRIRDRIAWCVIALCFAVTVACVPFIPSVNMSLARIQNAPLFYLCGCAGSIGTILFCVQCPKIKSPFVYLGRNSLIIMALHMDAPIEIAWMFLGKLGIVAALPIYMSSMIAVLIEMFILDIAILVIQKYTSIFVKSPKRKLMG